MDRGGAYLPPHTTLLQHLRSRWSAALLLPQTWPIGQQSDPRRRRVFPGGTRCAFAGRTEAAADVGALLAERVDVPRRSPPVDRASAGRRRGPARASEARTAPASPAASIRTALPRAWRCEAARQIIRRRRAHGSTLSLRFPRPGCLSRARRPRPSRAGRLLQPGRVLSSGSTHRCRQPAGRPNRVRCRGLRLPAASPLRELLARGPRPPYLLQLRGRFRLASQAPFELSITRSSA